MFLQTTLSGTASRVQPWEKNLLLRLSALCPGLSHVRDSRNSHNSGRRGRKSTPLGSARQAVSSLLIKLATPLSDVAASFFLLSLPCGRFWLPCGELGRLLNNGESARRQRKWALRRKRPGAIPSWPSDLACMAGLVGQMLVDPARVGAPRKGGLLQGACWRDWAEPGGGCRGGAGKRRWPGGLAFPVGA